MNRSMFHRMDREMSLLIALLFLALSAVNVPVIAQQPSGGHPSHAANSVAPSEDGASLADQLRQLQSKVAQLEAALKQNHAAIAGHPAQPGGIVGQGIGMMDNDMGEMRTMQPGQGMAGGGGMGMMDRGIIGMDSMQFGQGKSGMGGMGMSGKGNMPTMGGMSGQGMPGMGGMHGQTPIGKSLDGSPGRPGTGRQGGGYDSRLPSKVYGRCDGGGVMKRLISR